MRTVTYLAAALAMSLAAAHAEAPDSGDDRLRLNNILRHMQTLPFAP
jgi:hypothetical protein